ncbi:hypothetical protein ACIQVO_35005 [Streptomyces sp. NPDC101062]|uniref:hypothetical protein n=1 Tax=unclassified Streptomyces TaxID=2593676 RepID=UPI0037F838CE
MLERLEEPPELLRVDQSGHAGDLLGPVIDEEFTRHDHCHIPGAEMLELGDVLGVGERRSLDEDLTRVEILVNGGAATVFAVGAVEAELSCHGRLPWCVAWSPSASPGLMCPHYSVHPLV